MALSPRFQEALQYAAALHNGQVRKGSGAPYVSHLLGVCSIALEHGANEDEAIAALLHDAVEDQGGDPTLQAIRARFGDSVAAIVEGCSDSNTVPKAPWRERKERYLAHLHSAGPSVRLVSAADKLHNARSILADYHAVGDALWDRFRGKRDGTLWYYRAFLDTIGDAAPQKLLAELRRTVAEIEELVNGRG